MSSAAQPSPAPRMIFQRLSLPPGPDVLCGTEGGGNVFVLLFGFWGWDGPIKGYGNWNGSMGAAESWVAVGGGAVPVHLSTLVSVKVGPPGLSVNEVFILSTDVQKS